MATAILQHYMPSFTISQQMAPLSEGGGNQALPLQKMALHTPGFNAGGDGWGGGVSPCKKGPFGA